MHKPIQIHNLELSFPHKTCFAGFNAQINHGNRIAIIGRNGSGKTTLLQMIHGTFHIALGSIKTPQNITIAYVPQIIDEMENLSGGQRLNKAITQALSLQPDVLLLDEPTNHLDRKNRKSLMRMISKYQGTLIIVSHDTELLHNCIDTIWNIDNGRISVFSGKYDDYMNDTRLKRNRIERQLTQLDLRKKEMHNSLMQEQKRASKSKARGEKSIDQRKWPTIVSKTKALRAAETSGRKRLAIEETKQDLNNQLSNLRLPEIIIPKFHLNIVGIKNQVIVSINNGAIGYFDNNHIVQNINLSLTGGKKLAITGYNATGKSTLLRAILDDPIVYKSGEWYKPKPQDIGYLDQHYSTLITEHTVFESISCLKPEWSHAEIRNHLNDFLFRKNEEINTQVKQLSGGEKARLSLAQIAAKTPNLLLLDEITNNLDIETQEHLIDILRNYPGSIIVVSHDDAFLEEIKVDEYYSLNSHTPRH